MEVFSLIFYRSEEQTITEQVKVDVDISEFFELNDFQSEAKLNDVEINLKFKKLLMTGELGEDMERYCKNGGINLMTFHEVLK